MVRNNLLSSQLTEFFSFKITKKTVVLVIERLHRDIILDGLKFFNHFWLDQFCEPLWVRVLPPLSKNILRYIRFI